MSIAIGTYLKFIDAAGIDTGNNFQNFFQGETREYQGDTYIFGGFGFSGGNRQTEVSTTEFTVRRSARKRTTANTNRRPRRCIAINGAD